MADHIETDLKRVARLGVDKANANIRFRTYVKVRLDIDDDELDKAVRETTDEVWRHIDCTTCANCCKTFRIVLDNQDIERLAKAKGISFKEFERIYIAKSEGEKHFRQSPCPFLRDNRCTVYEHRPNACRDFPYLHSEGFRSRMLMMVENAPACPIVFNTLERLKKRLRARNEQY